MKVLWVTSVAFPPLCKHLKIPVSNMCGWVYASAKALLSTNIDIQLGVITCGKNNVNQHYTIDGIDYFLVRSSGLGKYTKSEIIECEKIIEHFRPDIIHLQGTEYAFTLAMAIANDKKAPILANIQGLASGILRYADGLLSFKTKLFNITILDIFRDLSMLRIKNRFKDRAEREIELIKRITDIVGRTSWDKAHSLAINPNLYYHRMEESLRDEFYIGQKWSQDKCRKHTIFVSSSQEPLKGAHIVLQALPLILRYVPDIQVRFTGYDILKDNFTSNLHMTGYKLYVRRLIRTLNLEKHVKFLGYLSAEDMKKEFLSANLYILPSAIENSPNSLCEAQLLGVPVVASYCGGVPDMVNDGYTGYLYRYEEYEMLAQIVVKLLTSESLEELSVNEIRVASQRHDRNKNAIRLFQIYNDILSHKRN